jgi:large subunit ribosomal protein L4
MANKRKTIAHTKTRAEVSGGGRKPWPQKGLGRARHGSIRSPLWRHGGIAFGPRKERVFKKKIPKKMKRKALFMVLSQKLKDGEIILVKELKIEKPKTKIFFNILKKLPLKKSSALIALPKVDRNLVLASRNIPKIKTILAKDLNCLDLLSFKYLILPVDSIKVIEKTFLK